MQIGEGSSWLRGRWLALVSAGLPGLLLASALAASPARAYVPNEAELSPLYSESIAMFGITDCRSEVRGEGHWEQVCRKQEVLSDGTGWLGECTAAKLHHHAYAEDGSEVVVASPPESEVFWQFDG